MPNATGLMSNKSPIYKYAKKKGITEDNEHDVLLEILKAGRAGKTIRNIEMALREYKDELPQVLQELVKKGVIVSKGNKFIGVYASVNNPEKYIIKALARVLESQNN